MRRFAGVALGDDVVPDEAEILRSRHLLEKHGPTEATFDEVSQLLEERRLLLKSGTILGATIIAAPSSTKNATESREPELCQTRKGKTRHLGMKLHVGTSRRGLVQHLPATHAATADTTQVEVLLHGEEREIFSDRACWSEAHRQRFREAGVKHQVNRRGNRHCPLTEHRRSINRSRSRHRARAGHPFHVVKRRWCFMKKRRRR